MIVIIIKECKMLDIKFVYDNRDLVKENIKKKFQDEKLPLVDEVCAVYDEKRNYQNLTKNFWIIFQIRYMHKRNKHS